MVGTGRERSRRTAVIRMDQTKRGVWYWVMAGGFTLTIVVTKFMVPRIEQIPARWSEKIVKSTEAPVCARLPARGGLFSRFQHQLSVLRMQVGVEGMWGEVRSFCYLFEGVLYQGHQLLGEQVSCRSL